MGLQMLFLDEREYDRSDPMITADLETIRAKQDTRRSMSEGLKQLVDDWRAEINRLADQGIPVSRL
jgi:hypothetical protein